MKQYKNNKTNNTLVRSQKRQKKRKRRESSTKEEEDDDDDDEEDEDDDDEDDDVKVDDWQRRYFTPGFLNHYQVTPSSSIFHAYTIYYRLYYKVLDTSLICLKYIHNIR